MNPTLEDLMRTAFQSGSAVGDGTIMIAYDFDKTPTSGTIGPKRVGISIPANRYISSGFMNATTATTGAFTPQIVVAGDVFPAQTALAIGATIDAAKVSTGSLAREVFINVTAVATGKILIFLQSFPLK